MATFWERIQNAYTAALSAWRAPSTESLTSVPVDDLAPEYRERAQFYEKMWKYYEGKTRDPLKIRPGKPNDNVKINHCRRIIDKGVSFLFGKDLTWTVRGLADEQKKQVDLTFGADPMVLLSKIGLNGGVCGTAYIQVLPPSSAEPARLVNLYPGIVFPRWDNNDFERVLAYELRWRTTSARPRRQIWGLDDGGRWEFWSETRGNSLRWEKDMDPTPWPFPWAPIIPLQNLPNPNVFYGLSDLEDAALNDTINFMASNLARVLRIYGHPILWGWGFQGQDLAADPGKAILANGKEAGLQYLQGQSDVGGGLNFWIRLTAEFYKTARVPEMDPSVMSLGAKSGFALRVLYSDLLEKTETKRRLYGAAIVEAYRRMADLLGLGEDVRPSLQWQDPLPPDETGEMARDQFEMAAGIAAPETVATRRGYDYREESRKIQESQAKQLSLGQLMVQKYSKGLGLGVKTGQEESA